jgi:hypothetical protein
MYSIGGPHALREPCRSVIRLSSESEEFFTDAEVFQELLHRYIAIDRWTAVRSHFTSFLTLLEGRIEPMMAADVLRAADLAEQHPTLSARGLIHVAVMMRVGAAHIVSADTSFDAASEIERLDPMKVDEWRELVTT